MLRLLTYNLHFGGGKNQNLWKRMMDELTPDIVFAQETRHPQEYFTQTEYAEFRSCIHQNVPTHGQWGSAILSKRHELQEVSVTDSHYHGWAVGALVRDLEIGGEQHQVLLVSFHAPSINNGSYEKHVEEMLQQLESRWPNTPMIIGGDFNLTTAYSRPESALGENTAGEIQILNMLNKDLCVKNAWQHLHPTTDLPQTLRWSGNKATPYHCDAVFINSELLPYIADADVLSEGDWSYLSDHNPIRIVLS